MYILVFGDNFISSVKKLDRTVAVKVNNRLKILQSNPFHATLHTKPLHGRLKGFYSLRVGKNYRVIFKFVDSKKIMLIIAQHRSRVYKK